MGFLVSYFLKSYEASFMTFSHLQALLDGENHFCYLVPNSSYKGGSLFQLNLDRLYTNNTIYMYISMGGLVTRL